MNRRAACLLLAAAIATPGPAPSGAPAAGPSLPRAALIDQDGRSVRLDELARDRPILLGFFFTGCSTVCPTQTATLRDLQEDLRHDPAPPLLVSVSLDPLGDTPAAIRGYADRFELQLGEASGWLMLTGTADELAKVWRAFDAAPAGANDHAPVFWLARSGSREWTRKSVFAAPAALARALREPAS